jgi:2,5-dioxopentanoate dehydrogenase
MNISGGQIIGQNLSKQGSNTFESHNAQTGESLGLTFTEATEAELNQAVELAQTAFWQYRKTSGETRAKFLETIADEIVALGDDLIKTAMLETALPEARLVGERGRTVGQLKLFAGFIRTDAWQNRITDTAEPDRQPLPKPYITQKQIPLGVVGVFGASNFPLAFSVAGGDTVAALAAGCPVVFKAHPAHPATCELVGMAIKAAVAKCGLADGVFSLLQGTSNAVGGALVQHPLVKAVGFTGSFRGGKALYDLAVRRPEPIPVYAEMGSTNPVFFLEGALRQNAEQLAQNFVGSITMGVGQFCTNPGVFVVNNSNEDFVTQVAEKLGTVGMGSMLTAGIRKAYVAGIEKQRDQTAVESLTAWTSDAPSPHLLKASVQTAIENHILTEEVFGPSSVAVVADGKADLLAFAHSLEGHLTATIFGSVEDLAANEELIEVLTTKVGRLVFNAFPTGVEVCHSMVHGGPFPATTDARSTSVGTQAIYRFTRPIAFQGFPEGMF